MSRSKSRELSDLSQNLSLYFRNVFKFDVTAVLTFRLRLLSLYFGNIFKLDVTAVPTFLLMDWFLLGLFGRLSFGID